MRVTAFSILLFFVSLNLSLYFINETQILPYMEQPPYTSPEDIGSHLVLVDVSAQNLLIGGSILAVGFVVGWITGRMIYGGTVAIILFAMDLLFPVVRWTLFGFPLFLNQLGVHYALTTIFSTVVSLVFFWFIIGFIGQRQMET